MPWMTYRVFIVLMVFLTMACVGAPCSSTALLTLFQLSPNTSRDRLIPMAPLIADNRLRFCSTQNVTCVFANHPSSTRYNVKGMKYYFIHKLLKRGFDCVMYVDVDAVIVKDFRVQDILDSSSKRVMCSAYLCRDLLSSNKFNTGVMVYTRRDGEASRLLQCMTDMSRRSNGELMSDQLILNDYCLGSVRRRVCVLDRSLWNAFPVPGNATSALWSAMGLPLSGDEHKEQFRDRISYIVHFAGESCYSDNISL